MSAAPASFRLTWEEFLALPDDPRYRHAELVNGQLVLMNPPTWLHQQVIIRLVHAIQTWILAGPRRGSVTIEPPVQITNAKAYLPDVAWYRDGRSRPTPGNPYLTGAPDLAVEVLSPGTRTFDLFRKRIDYAKVGVGELWLIDPDGPDVLVLRPPADVAEPTDFEVVQDLSAADELTSPLLPGLAIRVGDLVADE